MAAPAYMFVSPFKRPPIALQGSAGASAFAMNSAGDLFVLERGVGSAGPVLEYAPPYSGAPVATITATNAQSIGIDSNDNLFIAAGGAGALPAGINMFAPPYTGPPVTIANGVAGGTGAMAFDTKGNLFVAATSVLEFSPPFSSSSNPVVSVPSPGEPLGVAPNGDLVSGNGQAAFSVFAPPYARVLATNPTAYAVPPKSIAFDAQGDLWIAETSLLPSKMIGVVAQFSLSESVHPLHAITTLAKAIVVDAAGNAITLDAGPYTELRSFAPPYDLPPVILSQTVGGGATPDLFLSP
jgi:hypothetical protein